MFVYQKDKGFAIFLSHFRVLETQVEAAAAMLTNRDATQNVRIATNRERHTGRRRKGKRMTKKTVKKGERQKSDVLQQFRICTKSYFHLSEVLVQFSVSVIFMEGKHSFNAF